MELLNANEIYEQYVRSLPSGERLQLLIMTAKSLSQQTKKQELDRKRDILELHGLGKEIWRNVDVESYVNSLREEWNDTT
ncbi:MAG: hypothetical protein KDE48_24635 [Anaerolineales bacterium]|nr:hypothetical protein [Anaerolineales bacterium]